ncbi:MAG: hypothetical protein ACI8RD_005519 [Bacillariaceae sp.]|jgi:hypothetical protein
MDVPYLKGRTNPSTNLNGCYCIVSYRGREIQTVDDVSYSGRTADIPVSNKTCIYGMDGRYGTW